MFQGLRHPRADSRTNSTRTLPTASAMRPRSSWARNASLSAATCGFRARNSRTPWRADSSRRASRCSTSGCAAPRWSISRPRTFEADGGIMVTASHNPADYNGLKLVREEARPISADTRARGYSRAGGAGRARQAAEAGRRTQVAIFDDYIDHMLSYVDVAKLKPLKLVVNAGNGVRRHRASTGWRTTCRSSSSRSTTSRTARFRTAYRIRCCPRTRQ